MKNRILLFVILSIGYYKTAYTQILYAKQDSLNNNFYSISEEIGSDNLIVTNFNKTSTQNGDFTFNTQLLRINNSGAIIDSIQIDTNFSTYGRTLVTNDAYYVYGAKYIGTNTNSVIAIPTLIKYDSNFNVIKSIAFNSYSGMVVGLSQTTVLKNNNIYVFFGFQYSNIKCYKLDLNLIKLDSAVFNGTFIYDAINYGDNLLVCGTGFPYPSPMGRLQVHELDTTFQLVSYFNMDSLTHVVAGYTGVPGSGCSSTIGIEPIRGNLLEISKNKYLVSGYYDVPYTANCQYDGQHINSIIKNNHQVLKTNILGKQNGTHEATTAFTGANGKYNYLYTVSKSGANPSNPLSPQNVLTEIMVTKLDTNGTVIWNNFYSTPDYYYDPYSIVATSDSGVAVCGVRYNIVNPAIAGVCEGFVMKLDKNGNQQFTGINDKEISFSNHFNLFPNPAKNATSLSLDLVQIENVSITVLNTVGEIVYYESLNNLSAGNHVVNFNTENWVSGIYNINITTTRGTTNRKLVIAK